MIITYNGIQSFKVQFGDVTIAFDPISKKSSHTGARFGADIALSSLQDPDCNGFEMVSHAGKEPFCAFGPGAYEVRDIFIKGFLSKSNYKSENRINTIYSLVLEGMNLCFLGALGDPRITSDIQEELDVIDILFVPIGGEGVLDPEAAYKFAVSLEPSIIIPMHYGEVGEKDALKRFLKEGGQEKDASVEKLTIKKKDLLGMQANIIVIKKS